LPDNSTSTNAVKAWVLFGLLAAAVLYGSLYPWHLRGPEPRLAQHFWSTVTSAFELTLNVAIYVPIGFFLCAASRSTFIAVLGGTLISLTAETAQIFIVTRESRAADVLANTAGAGIGAALAGGIARVTGRSVWLPSPAAALVSLWAAFQLYPFQSVGRFARFAHNSFSAPSATSGFSTAADWVAAFTAAITWLHGRPRLAVACTAALFPLRIVLTHRSPDATELAGWAAATLFCLVFASHVGAHPRAVGLALAVAVLFRELAPFRVASTAAPFQWMPFRSLLSSDWFFAILLLLQKCFVYAALVWLWGRNRITLVSTVIVTVGIVLVEALQRYLPGRTPDITDAVLVLALAASLRLCEEDTQVRSP